MIGKSETSENQKVRISDTLTLRHSGFLSILNISVIIFIEELFFFGALLLWSWVKAHEPSIQGLEKFMDYGFMQSILNAEYFPASDMWWQGGFINYYYFGHLVTAVLTRLSGLDLSVTFNLMLATLFALTLTMSFSIGVQLSVISYQSSDHLKAKSRRLKVLLGGILTAFLVTFAGNMQTLYVFTKGYLGDNVVPFWTILWSVQEFSSKLGEGMNRYWYANATRFIPFTIHEFPSYSFVVSDVHGHVLSIPFVLLAIAFLIVLFCRRTDKTDRTNWTNLVFYGFLLGILLMTNALDGPIYGLLFTMLIAMSYALPAGRQGLRVGDNGFWKKLMLPIGIVGITAFLTALPFLKYFNSFASGIGVNCPLGFLANTKIGPFIFEGVEKCQKSPFWMMELLWGFFWFTGVWLFVKRIWGKWQYDGVVNRILKVFFLCSLILIIIPEFFYVKDIYPAHFRSNTMFKLGYEAFILWSITASYVIVYFIFQRFQKETKVRIFHVQIVNLKIKLRILFFVLLIPQLLLVSIYPIFSVRSYFGELKTYHKISGTEWLEKEYPDDWNVILWLKQIVHDNPKAQSVIVEADGDSYTDYNHISAFSGVPSIVGWAVHEWLWRGTYDEIAPRRDDVKKIYTSSDIDEKQLILAKYSVRYIIVGNLEREKYPDINLDSIASIGAPVFQSGDTVVYEVGER